MIKMLSERAAVKVLFLTQEYVLGQTIGTLFIKSVDYEDGALVSQRTISLSQNSGYFWGGGFPGDSDGKESTCNVGDLYAGQEATVRTGLGTKEWLKIGKGVYQGYILSPCLFILYAQYIM